MGYVLLKLGEKTTRSSASWMNRCLLALIGNRVTNGLRTGIANRTTEVAITPKGFLPKTLLQKQHQIVLQSPHFLKLRHGFQSPSVPKNIHCAGDAYPCAVTMHGIRPHLDTIRKAFCVWSTDPFPRSA